MLLCVVSVIASCALCHLKHFVFLESILVRIAAVSVTQFDVLFYKSVPFVSAMDFTSAG